MFFAFVAVAALLAASVATAANGGFTPVTPHSPNAAHTNTAYYVILGFTAAIFVLVEGLLVVFVVKYRQRSGGKRTDEGAQVHGHTRLELIWTVVPVLILCVIGIVVFVELPHISSAPAASNPLRITVEGHQFYWQFDYPNGARTINDLYVPVDRVVDLKIVSGDVIHSWWIPELGGKIQALPGITNHTWFDANDPGTYVGQCAELCGLYHASMTARVIATGDAEYQSNVATASKNLGKTEYTGVCATCHGMTGQGGYGPNLSNNPLLTQKSGLLSIVENGRGKMPAVGDTWDKEQLAALAVYVKTHIFKGAASGG